MKFRLTYRLIGAATLFVIVVSPPLRAQSPTPSGAVTLRQAGTAKHVILGAAADPRHLDERAYSSTLAAQFEQLEPENQMKFQVVHPRPGSAGSSFDFSPADKLVAFAEAHNMKVRGHCFVWHQQVPEWLITGVKNHEYNAAALSEILRDHIATVAKHYAGKSGPGT